MEFRFRMVLVACTWLTVLCGSTWAQDLPSAVPQFVQSVGESPAVAARSADATPAAARAVLEAAEYYDPLQPVDTGGPRETLGDFLRRVDHAQRLVGLALESYLGSEHLYPSADERSAMLRGLLMAETAGGLLEFEGLPLAIESPEFRVRVLLTLRDLLARVELPPLDTVPDGAAMTAAGKASWRVPGTSIEIRRMPDGPRAGEWLFTAATIQSLDRWYRYARDLPYRDEVRYRLHDLFVYSPMRLHSVFPPRWLLDLPAPLNARFLEQPLWRWLAFFTALAIAWAVFTFIRRCYAWWDARTRAVTPLDLWLHIAVPLAFGLLVFALREFSAHILRFSSTVYAVLMIGFTLLIYVTVIRLFWLVAAATAESVIASSKINTTSVDGQLIRLTLRFVAVILTLGVLIEGANRVGLPAYSILTGLGVGGVAVALAARESLANLMGSFIVMIEKPFRVGQKIRVDDVEGTVEDIGFRSTRIRTDYDSLVSIPSSRILETPIDNLGLRSVRRVKTTIGVAHGTSRDVLAGFIDAVREIIAEHPQTRVDGIEVGLRDISGIGLEIALEFLVDVRQGAAELRCREDVFLRILDCAERMGVEFASSPAAARST